MLERRRRRNPKKNSEKKSHSDRKRAPKLDKKTVIDTLYNATRPMIIVEGTEDSIIYKWIERSARSEANMGINPQVEPAGNRSVLEAVCECYEANKGSFPKAVVFIADQDEDLFANTKSVSKGCKGIIWTAGYSIENDLYAGVNMEFYLEPKESKEFNETLNSIIFWFTGRIQQRQELRKGKTREDLPKIKIDLDDLVPPGNTSVCSAYRLEAPFDIKKELLEDIKKNYKLKIRGKFLFDLLARFLSSNDRRPWHCRLGLFETACKLPKVHKYRDRLIRKIQEKLKGEIENHAQALKRYKSEEKRTTSSSRSKRLSR